MYAGIPWENIWRRLLTTVLSKFGAPATGAWKPRSRSRLRIRPERSSEGSGTPIPYELVCFAYCGRSWSPDGAHITASNATNNKGYVFIAAVIARGTWTSEISLVGHENTVEVAVCRLVFTSSTQKLNFIQAYNPHIFLRDSNSAVIASNICSVAALGADDRSVSVWQTKSARPLVVAKEVFERQIMDLSW